MNYRHLLSVCRCGLQVGLILFTLSSQAILAAPRLQALPIKLLGYIGDDLKISFVLPCGASFYGLIAAADHQGKLALAAASMQPEILCTGLSEERELVVKYIATSGFKTITSLATDQLLNRLALLPVSEVLTVKHRRGGRSLRAVYETRCGKALGTLIRQTSATDLEVAMIELRERPLGVASVGAKGCDFDQKQNPIRAIALNEGYAVQPLVSTKDADLKKAYYLRIAPLAPDSLEKINATKSLGPISLRYWRACNEAPIGIVASRTRSPEHTVKIGVLVAHYMNLQSQHCNADLALPQKADIQHGALAGEWAEYTTRDLDFHRSQNGQTTRLVALPGATAPFVPTDVDALTEMDALRLKTPYELTQQQQNPTNLKIDFFKTCEETLGVVYGRDPAGRLAVGILTTANESVNSKANNAYSCKKLAPHVSSHVSFEASMMQPFLARHVRAADLYPMKLKGF